jgi:3-deoxy-D-manno-octulosonic-acid transferase
MNTRAQKPTQSSRLGLAAYRMATRAVGPAVPYLLAQRLKRGKEDGARLCERQGISTLARPDGTLVWLHAASVGESLSVLPLIDALIAARDDINVLVTTGTVTSARLMAERLPARAVHQYVPLDHPNYCARFLDHWRPDLGVWIESEFWPNLIASTDKRGIPLALVNARITQRSFEGWQRFPKTIADIVGRFSVVFAQDSASARRLTALGATAVEEPGNLKYDAAPLTADKNELAALEAALSNRPRWLATNTHDDEEMIAAQVHETLAARHPGLLTFIVPRHPARGDAIATALRARGLNVVQRSAGETITSASDIYLGDTLGELGLFYRLSEIAFIGGTMAEIGGHNPFEPARLRTALIAGPSDFNFAEGFAAFAAAGSLDRVMDGHGLAEAVDILLTSPETRTAHANAAAQTVEASGAATRRTCEALLAFLPAKASQKGARDA